MRLTRAAQRAQEGPDSASEPIEAVNGRSRAALHDISPNTSPEQPQCEEERPPKTPARTPAKKGKAKGGAKKGAKGKKTKNIEEQLEDELVQQPVEQEHDAAVEQEATNGEFFASHPRLGMQYRTNSQPHRGRPGSLE